VSLFFFFLGYFDDKYKLSPNVKLLSTILLLLLAIFLDRDLLLTKIRFTFYSKEIFLGNYSYLVTVICFLLFINALNMLDGINGQTVTYAIYIFFIFIFNKVLINFSFILIIFFLFFLILNFKNKSYLGDSGSILLGYIISYLFIKFYNTETKFYADEIFLIMSIPGYELLRLAIKRILDKKHPFHADNNHIHHLMVNKFNLAKTYLTIQGLLVFPYFFYLLFNNFFYSLFLSLTIYSICIYFFSKK
jgi:UDP-N-acetylmuramyl pentapeptide phosphotransferase/UDP-N-acetylglucosamine-1-phosphate transferase